MSDEERRLRLRVSELESAVEELRREVDELKRRESERGRVCSCVKAARDNLVEFVRLAAKGPRPFCPSCGGTVVAKEE